MVDLAKLNEPSGLADPNFLARANLPRTPFRFFNEPPDLGHEHHRIHFMLFFKLNIMAIRRRLFR